MFYIISFTFAWVISAEIWQRFSAARSVEEAKTASRGALYINIPLYLVVSLATRSPEETEKAENFMKRFEETEA